MKTRSFRRRRTAFTLIEVLVVVAIIALLVAVLLPSLAQAKRQAQGVQCLSQLRQIGQAMGFYGVDSRNYLPPFVHPIRYRFKNNSGEAWDPYWFEYLPFKYLANQVEIVKCPTDDPTVAQRRGRTGYPELSAGARKITFSYAMNDELPTPRVPTYLALATGLASTAPLREVDLQRYSPTLISRIKRPGDTDYLLETAQHNLLSGNSTLMQYRLDHGGAKNSLGQRDRMNLLYADTHGASRDIKTMWMGDFPTGLPAASNTWPGRLRQLWFGDSNVTSQILY
ncbi:MAG: hypothetical protein AMXMBFR83_15580 [Phycisphaerae bacterium]